MKNYVVITGASYGIGEALSYKSIEEGYHLILIARSIDKLEVLKEKLQKKNSDIDIITIKCDLSNMKEVQDLIESIQDFEIDILINNAGFGYYHSVNDQDLAKIDNMIDLNVKALTYLSTFFVSKYSKTETTKYLLNISSTGGYVNVPNAVTYCATKFYVSAFTEGLSKELKLENSKLHVKLFAPSVTETKFGEVATGNQNYQYKKIFAKYNTSQEVANYCYDLIYSDETVGYINRETYDFEKGEIKFDYDYSRIKKTDCK